MVFSPSLRMAEFAITVALPGNCDGFEGVLIERRRFKGGIHGFFTMDRGQLPHSGQAMEEINAFLNKAVTAK